MNGEPTAGQFFEHGGNGLLYLGEADPDAEGSRQVRVADLSTLATVVRADALGFDLAPVETPEPASEPNPANAGAGQSDVAPPAGAPVAPATAAGDTAPLAPPGTVPVSDTASTGADVNTTVTTPYNAPQAVDTGPWDGTTERRVATSDRRTGWTPGDADRSSDGRRSGQERRANLAQGNV